MKKIFYLLFLNFCFSFGQNIEKDSIPAIQIKAFNSDYKDFVVVEQTVYAITKGDSLVSFDLKNDKTKLVEKNVVAIEKTSKGNLILAKTDGSIFKNIGKNQNKIDFAEGKIFKVLVDKKDNPIVISSKSVYYKKEHFLPNDKSSMYRKAGRYKRGKSELIPADVYFLDSNERVWFGYDAGEWGGDVCFFDLKNKEFYEGESLRSLYYDKNDSWPKNSSDLLHEFPDKIKIFESDTLSIFPHEFTLSNIKGIAEDGSENFYTSESLMHFSVSGNLTKFKKREYEFYKSLSLDSILEYDSVVRKKTRKGNEIVEGVYVSKYLKEYLGVINYNPFDKHIYYYTNNGFFKIIEKDNQYSKEFIFRPWITWTSGMVDAVGYQMNVAKMEFISQKDLIFLTSNNGIGYFDGEKVKYFK